MLGCWVNGLCGLLSTNNTTKSNPYFINTLLPSVAVQFDLTDEETSALQKLLADAIEYDRYPLSPRVRRLRGILAKFEPNGPAQPPPARPPAPEEGTPPTAPISITTG
jgi:hypothetical protein